MPLLVAGAVALAAPASALAASPTVSSESATSTGATTASFEGFVTTGDEATSAYFEYALSTSTFCTSGGSSGTPTNTTTQSLPAGGDGTVDADASGLTAGSSYCMRLVAVNDSATADGSLIDFTVGLPSATTYDAESTGSSTAQVDGAVNPADQTTTYEVEYDLTSSSWCESGTGSAANTSGPETLGYTDSESHDVTVDLTGLTPGADYCAEIVATNDAGTSGSSPTEFVAGDPQAATDTVDSTGATTATVEGTVDPSGQATTYEVQYGLESSAFCTSGGSGTPTYTTTPQSLSETDTNTYQVNVDLTGLTAGDEYCAQLVASNSSATAYGGTVDFGSGDAVVETLGAASSTATTAVVTGSVDPAGQQTSYDVVYDVASSNWCTSDGMSGAPSSQTASTPLDYTDAQAHSVSVELTGLSTGTSYCAAISATNTSATVTAAPIGFSVGPPIVDTVSAEPTGTGTATVTGEVTPSYQSTSYEVQYDLASSSWCTSGGSSGSPTYTTSADSLGSTDDTSHTVTVSISGLSTGTAYCAQIQASNGAGSATGGTVTFTAGSPTADTENAQATGSSTGVVTGTVNPAGQSTSYQVEYDLASSNWCQTGSGTPANTTGPVTLTSTGGTAEAVSVDLTGLSPSTAYCAELVASNDTESSSGGQMTFTSDASGSAPTVSTSAADGITTTGAVLKGTVDPKGEATTYRFDYGKTTAYGSHTSTTSAGSGNSSESEQSTLTGLSPDTTYHYRIEATNDIGTTDGADHTFTTGSTPATATLTVTVSGTGSGSVSSSPAGIDCSASCSHAFTSGTKVTLTPRAASGATFSGWQGACSGTAACTVTMKSAETVTASFTEQPTSTPPPTCRVKAVSPKVPVKTEKQHGKTVKAGTLSLTLKCSQALTAHVRGTVTETLPKTKHQKKAKTKRFSVSTSAKLSAGKSTTVTLKLPKAAVTALADGRKESAKLTLTASDSAGSVTKSLTIALRRG